MALADHSSEVYFNYDLENVFKALEKASEHMNGIKLDRLDPIAHVAYLKAGVSLLSWGENISVSLSQSDRGGTKILITSAPKTGISFAGSADMGKNQKNIKIITEAVSEELKNFSPIKHTTPIGSSADEILKYKKLMDAGVISPEEFEAKKKQLLGL